MRSNLVVPGAIDGRHWETIGTPAETVGQTDVRRRMMAAPAGDTPLARFVRLHELAHARITPSLNPHAVAARAGCSHEAIQWAEDARVAGFLNFAGKTPDEVFAPGGTVDEILTQAVRDNGGRLPERLFAGCVMAHWTGELPYQLIDAAVRAGGDRADAEAIAAVAVDLVERVRRAGVRRGRRGRRPSPRRDFRDKSGFRRFSVPLAVEFDAVFPPALPPGTAHGDREIDGRTRKVRRVLSKSRWGKIGEIRRPKLTISIRPPRPPRRRHSDSGCVPTAMYRLPVDGQVFRTKHPKAGGTVLCDWSGSMSYSDEDIARIIRLAPAATIAFYSGSTYSGKGAIIIGAENGRAATIEELRRARPGSDNVVDAPALRWLAAQKGPLFWVSDEEVGFGGGSDFGYGSQSWRECRAICEAAGIKIVADISRVMK